MKDLSTEFVVRAAVAIASALGLWAVHPAAAAADEPARGASVAAAQNSSGASPAPAGSDRPGAGAPRTELADMDLEDLVKVKVSPFDVSMNLDKGYRASNSVTGSRFDAPIRDLPFAIQAFNESFIEDQRPLDIFDVARYSPGVTYRSNDFNEGNANLAIRGFTVSATPGNVQILRDGFHCPSIFNFTNISRVEVVKGPASFLYGQVAPGGVVNIITKSPQAQFAAVADATYGSYDEYRFDVDVTGPLFKKIFYRVAASYDQDMHYWKPYDAHSWNLSPSLLWQPFERLSISLKYERFDKGETPQLMQKPAYGRQSGAVPTASDPNRQGTEVPGLPDTWNSMSYADFRRSNTSGLSAWVDLKAEDHWTVRAGYSHQDYQVDALFSGNFGMANNATFLQGRRFRRQTYTNRDDTFEVQGLGKYELGFMSLRMLVGGQYVDRRFDNWAAQAPNDPALGSDPTASPLPLWDLRDPTTWNRGVTIPLSSLTENVTDQTTLYEDKSVFGGTTFGFFGDRLLALCGWRVTSTESRLFNHVAGGPALRIAASAVTPQYGVLYRVTRGLSAFASYAQSFVPASQDLRNPDGTTQPAEPSRGSGYDVGLKAELLEGRVSGTLTYFDIRNHDIVNDISHTDSAGDVVIYNVQSGEQRSRGVEVDATITPADAWQIYASYSFMDARIVEFSGNDAAILAEDPTKLDAAGQRNYQNVALLHNAPLQMSAPHLANLWTRYDFPRRLQGFHVGGGLNLVVNQTILPDGPQSTHQSYVLVNALAGYSRAWRGVRMSLDLRGKNLADAQYRPSQSTRSRPREVLLTLTARF